VLDYIFRELAISYLPREDLAHASSHDIAPDSMGRGAGESALPVNPPAVAAAQDVMQQMERVVSRGFTRNRFKLANGNGHAPADPNGAAAPAAALHVHAEGDGHVHIHAAGGAAAGAVAAAVGDGTRAAMAALSSAVLAAMDARASLAREARLKGYEGDACSECGNFTLVRNGTCLKCNTCGATSGCS
jgi:ribonucleoside-diphosphate reductase alpha chain